MHNHHNEHHSPWSLLSSLFLRSLFLTTLLLSSLFLSILLLSTILLITRLLITFLLSDLLLVTFPSLPFCSVPSSLLLSSSVSPHCLHPQYLPSHDYRSPKLDHKTTSPTAPINVRILLLLPLDRLQFWSNVGGKIFLPAPPMSLDHKEVRHTIENFEA